MQNIENEVTEEANKKKEELKEKEEQIKKEAQQKKEEAQRQILMKPIFKIKNYLQKKNSVNLHLFL